MKYSSLLLIFLLISCTRIDPRYPISHNSGSFLKESVLLNKKINALEKDAIMFYIAQDSVNEYFVSPLGFWYKYEFKIKDTKPLAKVGDTIVFEYEISDFENNVIYSNEVLGKRSYIVDKEHIESGLQDGLKLLKEGEEVVFLFPSFKTFGFTGDQYKVGVNQPLIYKVQLLNIN